MVVQRHLSRAIRLRDFVALALRFQRMGAAASRLDTLRLYSARGPGSLSLFQSDHESARKIPHAASSAAAARVLGLRPCGGSALVTCPGPTCGIDPLWLRSTDGSNRNAADFVVDPLPICPVENYKHRMPTALKNLWASVAIEAGAVLDRDRSGVGDLTLETVGLRPADRSRPSDMMLEGGGGGEGGGPACDYMIDFACVSFTTPTWGNDPRWCTPGIAATEAERNKLAADRASSAPVHDVHRDYPFVV
eukprot:jgi/Tetstr1/440817/TSEL_029124.t1